MIFTRNFICEHHKLIIVLIICMLNNITTTIELKMYKINELCTSKFCHTTTLLFRIALTHMRNGVYTITKCYRNQIFCYGDGVQMLASVKSKQKWQQGLLGEAAGL